MENKEMTLEEAIRVLHQIAELAQKSGILSIQDSALAYTAINLTTEDLKDKSVKKDSQAVA